MPRRSSAEVARAEALAAGPAGTAAPAGPLAEALLERCRSAVSAHRRRAHADGQALDYDAAGLAARAATVRSCTYCGRALLLPSQLAFDHARPPSRGCDAGSYRLANLIVCCQPCNESKGRLTADEYRQLLSALEGFPPVARGDVLARLRSGGRLYGG